MKFGKFTPTSELICQQFGLGPEYLVVGAQARPGGYAVDIYLVSETDPLNILGTRPEGSDFPEARPWNIPLVRAPKKPRESAK